MTLQARLEAYAELLRAWAPRLDLIAPGDLERIEERHIEDSLKALPVTRAALPGPAIDVGSGAGLPGIPLALADPGRPWRLLEPRAKRAAFLDEVLRELQLDAEVVASTAGQAARDPALSRAHAVVTARALAPPVKAFGLLRPLAAPDGIALVWIGKDALLPPDAEEVVPGLASLRF